MLKNPLFVFIFVFLFIGLSDYGYGCHRDVDHGPHTCSEPEPAGTVEICHFKAISKHCLELNEPTGGVRTIKTDLASIARHVEHGDCSEFLIPGPPCVNHCICAAEQAGIIEVD